MGRFGGGGDVEFQLLRLRGRADREAGQGVEFARAIVVFRIDEAFDRLAARQPLPERLHHVVIERARMRFLLGDTQLG